LHPYQKNLKPLARTLRSNMTDAEQLLWKHLRGKQIHGVQFYRQKPLAGYIADFYCAVANLIVEVDGSQHLKPEELLYDQERSRVFASLGLDVLRFDNQEVLAQTGSVLAVIESAVSKKIPPAPLLQRGDSASTTGGDI
jgi:very-short-patch-repair endonuclease